VQLVDTGSGAHLWAETFDRVWQAEEIFDLQDEITDRIIGSVADVYGVLARAIAATTAKKPPETLTPYEAVWRFFLAEQRGSAEDHLLTRIALENAVELQPGYAEAWAALAILLVDEYRHLFNPRPNSLERAMLAAERALNADPASQMANYAFAVAQYFRGDLGAFRTAAERTLALNPRCSYTMAGPPNPKLPVESDIPKTTAGEAQAIKVSGRLLSCCKIPLRAASRVLAAHAPISSQHPNSNY
jgi:adenylate cyclase